jgi:hypothetical protein
MLLRQTITIVTIIKIKKGCKTECELRGRWFEKKGWSPILGSIIKNINRITLEMNLDADSIFSPPPLHGCLTINPRRPQTGYKIFPVRLPSRIFILDAFPDLDYLPCDPVRFREKYLKNLSQTDRTLPPFISLP